MPGSHNSWPVRVAENISVSIIYIITMMTSSSGNIFRITGPLWGESTGHQVYGAWIKDIAFYVQKHIAYRAICYNIPLDSDKPLGVAVFV